MSLGASYEKVYDLLNDKMYHVAPNQRKYVWTNNNWQELLDDIELVYDGSFDNFNIEHCVPDAESEKNAHIGNLMLLEERINHDLCKGKPLDQKIQYYHGSALKLPVRMAEENPTGAAFNFDERSTWIAELLHSYITKVRIAEPAIPG